MNNDGELETCPFCGGKVEWVENKQIYGKNYGKSYMIWLCKPCDAYVGCHNNTEKPLGTLANKETREARKKAHAVFDPLWVSGRMSRKKAYRFLSDSFGKNVHIAQSNVATCFEIIETIKAWNTRSNFNE